MIFHAFREPEMDSAVGQGHKTVSIDVNDWQEPYKALPFLYFGLLIVWTALVAIWTFNTWSKRRWQTSNLQWVLTSVPVLKVLVLGLSFIFWYSCLNLNTCSFWVAFGVFVTRIFFETACFIGFLLISHGYCIMYEQLSATERRSIAGLSSLLYLTLTGYKAAVPQFAVLLIFIYFTVLYVIFQHVSKNLKILREQLQHIQEEGVQMMQSAVHIKYSMFKKFRGAMVVIVLVETMMHTRTDGAANEYWIWLLVREWIEIGVFFYIGWTFRSRDVTPFFTVIPTLHSHDQRMLPPIYSVEMNQNEFNDLDCKEWHIGVPTSSSKEEDDDEEKPMLVIVCNPGQSGHEYKRNNSTSNIARKSFNSKDLRHSPPFKQNHSDPNVKGNNKVSCSQSFFLELIKPDTKKIFHPDWKEKPIHSQSCIMGAKERVFPKRDSSLVSNSVESIHKTSITTRMIMKGSLQLEPILSQLV